MSQHPSTITLERLSVADLPPDEKQAVTAHIADCAECRELLEELDDARLAHLARMPTERFLGTLQERRGQTRRRLFSRIGMAFAAAAAAMLLVVIARPGTDTISEGHPEITQPDQIRFKGDSTVIHRKRGDDIQLVEPRAMIRAGDALRIDTAAPWVWFIDERGQVDPFDPNSGSAVVEEPCENMTLVVLESLWKASWWTLQCE